MPIRIERFRGVYALAQKIDRSIIPEPDAMSLGTIEDGEQPRDAMRRELEEELGIVAEVGTEVARIVHEYPRGGSVELRFFEVRSYQGEIENRIFREIRWVTRQELLGLDFLEADLGLVKELAAGKII